MIKAFVSSLSRAGKITQPSILAFSSVKDALKKKLDEEIKYQGDNKPSVNEYVNFFNNNGWDVNYTGTQVELTRKNADYNLRVLFNARNPSTDDANEEENQPPQQQQAEQDFNEDYSQISVYINKNGQSKWLCAEFFVTEQNSQIAGVRFVNNYDTQRTDRFKERNSSTVYPGPQIHSLEEALSDKIGEFIQSVGVDHALLQNASNFSVAYEHTFYLEWLKDIKSIL